MTHSGQFQPGHQKIPGSGRKKGTPNKLSSEEHKIRARLSATVLARMDRLLHYMDYMENRGCKDEATKLLFNLTKLALAKPVPRLADDLIDDGDDIPPPA